MAFSVVGGEVDVKQDAQFSPVSLKSRVPMGGRQPQSMRCADKIQTQIQIQIHIQMSLQA